MKQITFATACSGIGAPEQAWCKLGWRPVFCSEIDKFPSAVLRYHYPEVVNHGDFREIGNEYAGAVDVLAAGTPCQDFSVAGLRAGVAGDRGNLTLEFLRLAQRLRPRWLVWENVPGVYSSTSHVAPDQSDCDSDQWEYDADESHAFACFLAGLQELGYGFAYRTLDAQFFGVPQRRRRVFVVGHLGDWRRAAAVLFERHSLSGYPPPRREAGQGTAAAAYASTGDGFWSEGAGTLRAREQESHEHLIASTGDTAHCLNAGGMGRQDYETETLISFQTRGSNLDIGEISGTFGSNADRASGSAPMIAHALRADGFDASEDGTGRGTPIVPSLVANGDAHSGYRDEHGLIPMPGMAVRRLTPRECERLQGFPDDYTLIPYRGRMAADGPRYKALGNSMAVPCMEWIGRRIQMVEDLVNGKNY